MRAERVVGVKPRRIEVGSHIKSARRASKPFLWANPEAGRAAASPNPCVPEFDREVKGPLLVGAGRFAGLGLFRMCRNGEGRR